MAIEISGRHYEVTDKIRSMITTKLGKIEKYFADIIEIRCVLKVEKYRNICEIMIVGKSYDAKSSQEADVMEDAINSTIDHLKRQAQKSHTKVAKSRKRGPAKTVDSWTVQVFEPSLLRGAKSRGDDSSPRIISSNDVPIRPMSIEQAAMTLDDSKNEFIVFRDLDTDKVTFIYKRSDHNFGMIDPEF